MSYISLEYYILVAGTLIVYYLVTEKYRYIVLLVSSVVFIYLTGGWISLAFILLSAIFAWYSAKMLRKKNSYYIAVITTIIISLILVIIRVIPCTGLNLEIIVPIGLSFYSLSIISYIIDVYNEKIKPEEDVFRFILYVSYFPHIMQGPIARYDRLSRTLYSGAEFDYKRITRGCQLIVWGCFKKLVLADRMAKFVNAVYGDYASFGGVEAIVATIMFGIQLYADFSGCVDISIGVSELFGIELDKNFNGPYLSCSVKEFWRRWHITLSTWLRDYIYIPLGGSRLGKGRKIINLFITFLVSGLWHGVGLNFLIWGGIHGFYQTMEELLQGFGRKLDNASGWRKKCIRVFCLVWTFILVDFAWHFFRSDSIESAFGMILHALNSFDLTVIVDGRIFSVAIGRKEFAIVFLGTILLFVIDIIHEKGIRIRDRIGNLNLPTRWMIYLLAVFFVIIFGVYGIGYDSSDFLYIKF